MNLNLLYGTILLVTSNYLSPNDVCALNESTIPTEPSTKTTANLNSSDQRQLTVGSTFPDPLHFDSSWYERNPKDGVSGRHGYSGKDRFIHGDDNSHMDYRKYCTEPSKCEVLKYRSCFGARLPYAMTTLSLVNDSDTQDDIQEKLKEWEALRTVPKCWSIIQPFLCSVYMPRCEGEDVFLPSLEMCRLAREQCRIIEQFDGWPSFLKCDRSKFKPRCKNDIRELKFNTTLARCQFPLIATNNTLSYFEGVDGCGQSCDNPLLTPEQTTTAKRLIAMAGSMCFIANLVVVLTFALDWRSSKRYPAVVVFYLSFCFMCISVGWLAQFFTEKKNSIICNSDYTPVRSEHSLACVSVFVLVYFFLIAAMFWYVILAYSWHLSFRALGKLPEQRESQAAQFHLLAWSVPSVLTIYVIAFNEFEGSTISGICFLKQESVYTYLLVFLLPMLLCLTIGSVFLVKGLITLLRLQQGAEELVSKRAVAKLRSTVFRLGLFLVAITLCGVISVGCHLYFYFLHPVWQKSLREYIVCLAKTAARSHHDYYGYGGEDTCKMKERPHPNLVHLHFLVTFIAGLAVSSWTWTRGTTSTWQRFMRRCCNGRVDDHTRLKKHKLIAQAFAKRKALDADGRLSLSFHSSHEDPVGIVKDLNSVASQSLSTTWAAALPHFLTRRGAIVGNSVSSQRNSRGSDLSLNFRRHSDSHNGRQSSTSRRNSLDSQLSVRYSEVERLAAADSRFTVSMRKSERHRKKSKWWERRHYSKMKGLRRGSTTSQESSDTTSQIIRTVFGNYDSTYISSHDARRKSSTHALQGAHKGRCTPIYPVLQQHVPSTRLAGDGERRPALASSGEIKKSNLGRHLSTTTIRDLLMALPIRDPSSELSDEDGDVLPSKKRLDVEANVGHGRESDFAAYVEAKDPAEWARMKEHLEKLLAQHGKGEPDHAPAELESTSMPNSDLTAATVLVSAKSNSKSSRDSSSKSSSTPNGDVVSSSEKTKRKRTKSKRLSVGSHFSCSDDDELRCQMERLLNQADEASNGDSPDDNTQNNIELSDMK